ncbi:MAG: FecR domain-containing protein [Leptospira sp.]|nr:FecR domain-containing protein [Leptospira sp.]
MKTSTRLSPFFILPFPISKLSEFVRYNFTRKLFYLLIFLLPNVTLLQSESYLKEDGITITVEKGQTLSIISKTYLDDPKKWKELLKSNQIDNPNLIIPGKKLWIPRSLGKKPMADVQSFLGGPEVLKSSQSQLVWETVQLGLALYINDELRTDTKSIVRFLLSGGSTFELAENSQILMEKTKSDSHPEEMFLKRGRLRALVPKSDSHSKKMFILKTESASSEVKGTEFITEVDAKGNTSLSCYEGLVTVTAEKKSVDVKAGFATFVEKGKPPVDPFSIPKAPLPKFDTEEEIPK